MSKRQKRHQGRSEGDETTLEGRDIRADTPEGIGSERVDGAFEGGAEDSRKALEVEEALKRARKEAGGSDH